MRIALVALSLAAGCATSPPPNVAPPSEAESSTTAPRPATFGGSYVLSSSSGTDKACGGQLVLAAKHILVDQDAKTVYADVVNRTYDARFESSTLIAEGRFDVAGTCPGTKIYEKWTLSRDPAGRLVGELESHWSLPPYCQRACEVRFPIVATAE